MYDDLKRFAWIGILAFGGYAILGAFLFWHQPALADSAFQAGLSAPQVVVAPGAPAQSAGPVAGSLAPTATSAALRLAEYLTQATLSWMTSKPSLIRSNRDPYDVEYPQLQAFEKQEHESWDTVVARIRDVAGEVAGMFFGQEACLWPSEDHACPRTALLVMSLAFNESRFRGYVDDGRCNDSVWARSKEAGELLRFGTCDRDSVTGVALASTIFQLHDFHGDRQIAEREVLDRLRRSLRYWHDIRGYTGEGLYIGKDPPAAMKRQGLADRYFRAHPFS